MLVPTESNSVAAHLGLQMLPNIYNNSHNMSQWKIKPFLLTGGCCQTVPGSSSWSRTWQNRKPIARRVPKTSQQFGASVVVCSTSFEKQEVTGACKVAEPQLRLQQQQKHPDQLQTQRTQRQLAQHLWPFVISPEKSKVNSTAVCKGGCSFCMHAFLNSTTHLPPGYVAQHEAEVTMQEVCLT